jgi:hypothetical protein
LHVSLAELGQRSVDLAGSIDLPDVGFQVARKQLHTALDDCGLTREADQMVTELLLIV